MRWQSIILLAPYPRLVILLVLLVLTREDAAVCEGGWAREGTNERAEWRVAEVEKDKLPLPFCLLPFCPLPPPCSLPDRKSVV